MTLMKQAVIVTFVSIAYVYSRAFMTFAEKAKRRRICVCVFDQTSNGMGNIGRRGICMEIIRE